jgi:hypothetical protein
MKPPFADRFSDRRRSVASAGLGDQGIKHVSREIVMVMSRKYGGARLEYSRLLSRMVTKQTEGLLWQKR